MKAKRLLMLMPILLLVSCKQNQVPEFQDIGKSEVTDEVSDEVSDEVVEYPSVQEAVVLDDPEPETIENNHVIVIDPGHQSHENSGKEANGPGSSVMKIKVSGGQQGVVTGKNEYELTLEVSLLLKDELQARGYTVYLTRETNDVDMSNQQRAQFATEVGGDICLRIHADGFTTSAAKGASVLVPSASNPYVSYLAEDSQRLGDDILTSFCEATGIKRRGVKAADDMTGINFSTMPVAILEMGFLTNPTEDEYLCNVENHGTIVNAIADGIDAYYSEVAEE